MDIERLKIYNNLYDIKERKELIAEMLTVFRELNHLQKKDVAEYLCIKPQTYNAYESGRNEPPAEILVRLSLLYNVPVDIIIQRDTMNKSKESAKELLEYYDSQIDIFKEDLLKSGNNENMQKILDGIKQLTDTMQKSINKN